METATLSSKYHVSCPVPRAARKRMALKPGAKPTVIAPVDQSLALEAADVR